MTTPDRVEDSAQPWPEPDRSNATGFPLNLVQSAASTYAARTTGLTDGAELGSVSVNAAGYDRLPTALDFGLPSNYGLKDVDWQTACRRLIKVYERQAENAFVVISNLLAADDHCWEGNSDEAENRISHIVSLLGEPGIFSTAIHMTQANGTSKYGVLARSLAKAEDAATLALRLKLLVQGTEAQSARTRYLAVDALGTMDRRVTSKTLRTISENDGNKDVRCLARDLLE